MSMDSGGGYGYGGHGGWISRVVIITFRNLFSHLESPFKDKSDEMDFSRGGPSFLIHPPCPPYPYPPPPLSVHGYRNPSSPLQTFFYYKKTMTLKTKVA